MENTQTERDFKGVWIPKHIYLDRELSWTEKILLIEIDSLDKGEGCYASNEYLADFLQVSKGQIVDLRTGLRKKGYLIDRKFDGRRQWISVAKDRFNIKHTEKPVGSIRENVEAPPDYINNIENNSIKSKDLIGVPPVEKPSFKHIETEKEPPHASDPKRYGNGQVDDVITAFKSLKGHEPTDELPRNVAWNVYQRIDTFLKSHPELYSQYKLDYKRFLERYVKWLKEPTQFEWSSKLQTLKTFKLKLPMYFAVVERYLKTQAQFREMEIEQEKRRKAAEAIEPVSPEKIVDLRAQISKLAGSKAL